MWNLSISSKQFIFKHHYPESERQAQKIFRCALLFRCARRGLFQKLPDSKLSDPLCGTQFETPFTLWSLEYY
jgi:hypothetical protein